MRLSHAASFAFGLFLLAPVRLASAQETPPQLPPPEAAPPLPAPSPASAGPVTNVQSAPNSGGLTVIAPLAGGGTMTAVGCSSVSVSGHSADVRMGGAPQQQPCPVAVPIEAAPRRAADSGRKAAIITAPIVYGLGAMIAGATYLGSEATCNSDWGDHYGCDTKRNALWAYGIISAGVPSLPRWVVGDVTGALIFTGARGASIATAALVDWGHDGAMGPFLLGFAAPVTLAIVDMATTPHREDLAERHADKPAADPPAENGARITGVSPVAMGNREQKSNGAGVSLTGVF